MRFSITITPQYIIPMKWFNNAALIEKRVMKCPENDRSALRTTLKYLYMDNGPINLPLSTKRIAEKYLDRAEHLLTRWKYNKTNGSEKKHYGKAAGVEARKARYRCRKCGNPDVRLLDIDHVHGRKTDKKIFACLCVACHRIKSRKMEWNKKD